MTPVTFTKLTLMSCALAAAVACGGNNNSGTNAVSKGNENPNATTPNGSPTDATATRGTPGAAAAEHAGRAVTLTGCLQEGSGRNTFILTTVNEPGESVGTSGAGSGDAVRREQLREAERAYELDAKGDVNLRELVGKQIKVSGTLADRGDLPKPDATTGRSDRDKPAKIKSSDLAKVDVTEATVTGSACGQHGKTPARSKSRRRASRRG